MVHDELSGLLAALEAGAARFGGGEPGSRADLARRTALSVARAADEWAAAAVAMKRGADGAAAEELATGPLATMRSALLHARAWGDIARGGVPRGGGPPRITHAGGAGTTRPPLVEVDVLPAAGPTGTLHDGTIYAGLRATVRCHDPGGTEAFARTWRREAEERPRSGGVAVVLGAGNVTGLGAADVLSQVFEHGRAALLKLHPVQASLAGPLRRALEPLVEAGLVAIVTGTADTARAAIAAPETTHVHLTGGRGAFDAIVWGGPRPADPAALPVLSKGITCELGNVTPWFVLPGRYPAAVLAFQADQIAASIVNNGSFNCIATKVVVTCRSWDQRGEFLRLVRRRLASSPARPGWYPGAAAVWEEAAGRAAPSDGTLPWVFEEGIDPRRERRLVEREWFAPVACEAPLEAGDLAGWCGRALEFAHGLPGSLAASVTLPPGLDAGAARHAESLVDHLAFGVVAVNTWSALAYAVGAVPWGGFPGGTLADPRSGIGFVHDPLLLPLVHNSVVRGPARPSLRPAWFPWHRSGAKLARGVVELYARRAEGREGLSTILGMLPAVLRG